MKQPVADVAQQPQLSPLQFVLELLFGWRHLFAPVDGLGGCRSADVDRMAGAFRADFLRLPVLRFLNLDPAQTYTAHREFFRWAQLFCSKCAHQEDCSLLAARAKALPVFEQYCANAATFRRKMAEQMPV